VTTSEPEDNRWVAALCADRVDADALQAVQTIVIPRGLLHHAGDDPAHRLPVQPHQLAARFLRALRRQPGDLILERPQEAAAVARPGHSGDHHTVFDLVGRIAADVGRSRPDLSRAVSPDGTVTVLFTDIEGSTQLTEALGDAEWIRVLRAHNALIRDQVAAHSGIEVKSQGDGFMLAFASAEDALQCAIGIQRALARAPSDGHRLRVRIGLHTGEMIREEDDFFGKAVVLAARIAAEARGGEILVSRLVRELTEGVSLFSFTDPTDVELKGLSGMHSLWAVRWQTEP
jgi:class 3 adenylate cyclase